VSGGTATGARTLSAEAISFGERCAQLARHHPRRVAILLVEPDGTESAVTWDELDTQVQHFAWLLRRAGARAQSLIVIALPTGLEHFIAALAAWRLGTCVLPLNPDMPPVEREKLLDLAGKWRPVIIVGEWSAPGIPTIALRSIDELATAPSEYCEAVTPCPGKAIASGGSTGTPKIIVDPKPWAHVPGKWGSLTRVGLRAGQTQLLVGSLYHNVGFFLGHIGLFEGHTLIVPKRFNATLAVDLIERHRVQFIGLLPIMMQRIAKLPDVERRNFSSLEGIYHSGGVCPEWVKRKWLNMMPPARVWELYGSTEDVGVAMISGEEWLARPCSVGRGFQTDILVLDEHDKPVRPGEIGEIYMRSAVPSDVAFGEFWPLDPGCCYVGTAVPKCVEGNYTSVGDMGHMDDEGYLYLADRRTDMIKTGGINVYPAEVEATLSQHPEIQDVVVVGIPDEEWGQRVHALIQPANWPAALSGDELDAYCRQRLTAYKAPKSYELCQALPRDPSGKIRRSALRDARIAGHFPGIFIAIKPGQIPHMRPI